MDNTLMYSALVASEVDTITACSTDGRIPAFDLVLLEDPRGVFPPHDALLPVGTHMLHNFEGIGRALEPLGGGIGDKAMRAANRHVDVDAAKLIWDRLQHSTEP